MLKVLTDSDYDLVPWKNGGGVTKDVFLYPPGSAHEDFEIRLSLAPITAEGPFSRFPGIDRRITRLSAAGLVLEFEHEAIILPRLQPLFFDSVLQPQSRLPDGPALVFNVMTRRGIWQSEVRTQENARDIEVHAPAGGYAIAYAVTGTWKADGGKVLSAGETLFLQDEAVAALRSAGGDMLTAQIFPGLSRSPRE